MNVDLYSSKSIDSVATIATRVFGGYAGLIGSVGSLTLLLLSPVKFLMAMIIESRVGTSPGKSVPPGSSPIMVNTAAISSG